MPLAGGGGVLSVWRHNLWCKVARIRGKDAKEIVFKWQFQLTDH